MPLSGLSDCRWDSIFFFIVAVAALDFASGGTHRMIGGETRDSNYASPRTAFLGLPGGGFHSQAPYQVRGTSPPHHLINDRGSCKSPTITETSLNMTVMLAKIRFRRWCVSFLHEVSE